MMILRSGCRIEHIIPQWRADTIPASLTRVVMLKMVFAQELSYFTGHREVVSRIVDVIVTKVTYHEIGHQNLKIPAGKNQRKNQIENSR